MARDWGKLPKPESRSGYGNPPAATRFKRGQSGNPRGRPKGRRNTLPHDAVLSQLVTIREDGRTGRVPAAEAFLLYLAKIGQQGNLSASLQGLQAIAIGKSERPEGQSPIDIVIQLVSAADPHLALRKLGMAVKHDAFRPTARMALEPWVVSHPVV